MSNNPAEDSKMKLFQRRPTYQAAQFDGSTDSLKEMKAIGAKINTFSLTQDSEGLKAIKIHGFVLNYASPVNFVRDLNESDWLVIAEDGTTAVVTDANIWTIYEQAKA